MTAPQLALGLDVTTINIAKRKGQSPEWFCMSCGGLFFEDERAVWMPVQPGDDLRRCLCKDCNERSITHAMEWEDTIDWADIYTQLSE